MTLLQGMFLVLLGGSCWAVLGLTAAAGKEKHAPSEYVQPFGGILILLAAGWAGLLSGPLPRDFMGILQAVLVISVGVSNYFMLNLVQRAMGGGREGIVWAFAQSSLIFPFLMGMTVFREPPAWSRIVAILLILLSLILFAFGKGGKGEKRSGWLLPAIGAFLLSGVAQCCASIPSYFQIPSVSPLRRMLFLQTGILGAFLLDHWRRKAPLHFRDRQVWKYAAVFGGANLIGLLAFYTGQNLLADAKCACISYPAAQGINMILVFLWGSFRKRPAPYAWIALGLLIFGILLLCL